MLRMLDSYHSSLKQQALVDLTMRARGGIVIYLIIWLVMSSWGNVSQTSPLFFYLNTALFIAIAVARIFHYLLCKKNPYANVDLMSKWLVFFILAGAVHWGLMTAWVIFTGEYNELHYPFIFIVAAFAIGGTLTLSISRKIRVFYPLFIAGPTWLLLIFIGGTENMVLAILGLLSLAYVVEAARVSASDYWQAIDNHRIANERARAMEQLSITDPLTKLNNRMYFNRRFSEEWKRCSRLQIPLSIMMIDLDHFKKINDSYGHVFGDECLKKVAIALKGELLRVTDTLSRYGGEEFVILLPDTDLDNAKIIASRLVKVISLLKMTINEQSVSISCSIGLACTVPDHAINNQTFLITADRALYQAKEKGRNRWYVADNSTVN